MIKKRKVWIVFSVITYIISFAFATFYHANYILAGEKPLFSIELTVVISILLLGLGSFVWNNGVEV